jgi:mRNA interferase MazF
MMQAGANTRRGDLVTVTLPGAYGKPRPALVIQADFFSAHPSETILPVTSDLRPTPLFRVTLKPSGQNGLRKPSQVMVDKTHTVPQERLCETFGRLEDDSMLEVNRALALFLGFA